MRPLIYALPGAVAQARALAGPAGAELGRLHHRRFPDGESYFRLDPLPEGRSVILAARLDQPDRRTTLLQLVAGAVRAGGASRVGLVAPYLPYMRQDKAFHAGEPVSALLYAALISRAVDWLVTIDPHLHRIADLNEVYAIPAATLHAADLLSGWIRANVRDPLVVGPDCESRQWVAAVAKGAGAPFVVLDKVRLGDRQVQVAAGDLTAHAGRNPVIVDDVASSGRTLLEAMARLEERGFSRPVCLVVHSLATRALLAEIEAKGARLVSTDSVPGPAAVISTASLMAPAAAAFANAPQPSQPNAGI